MPGLRDTPLSNECTKHSCDESMEPRTLTPDPTGHRVGGLDYSPPTVGAQNATIGWLARGRVPGLEGLRAFSIILVLIEHGVRTQPSRWLRNFVDHLGLGGLGVNIFFGISGFLITLLLLREERVENCINLKNFYIRRLLRILPAYVAFLAMIWFFWWNGDLRLRDRDWLGLLTYTANFIDGKPGAITHIWSLSLEEQFYLMWPISLFFLGVRRGTCVLLGYLAFAPLFRVAVRVVLPSFKALAYTSPLQMESIVGGCLLAIAMSRYAHSKWTQRFLSIAESRWGIMAIVCAFVSPWFFSWPPFQLTVYPIVRSCAIAGLLVLAVRSRPSALSSILNWPPVVSIGVWSYSIYIWQQLVFQWPSILPFPLNFVVCVCAGYASYRCIETPFLRLKNRFVVSA